jgi:hypothetical protein
MMLSCWRYCLLAKSRPMQSPAMVASHMVLWSACPTDDLGSFTPESPPNRKLPQNRCNVRVGDKLSRTMSMSASPRTHQSRLSARLSVGRFSEWIFWFLIANYIM